MSSMSSCLICIRWVETFGSDEFSFFQTRWGVILLHQERTFRRSPVRGAFVFGVIMTITQQLKLNGIDIAGLNPDDRSRIEAIGLDAWLDEQSKRTRRSDRAKHKLAWFRKAGYDLDVEAVRCPELSKTDLRRFFSEVTDNELKMSNREFYSL